MRLPRIYRLDVANAPRRYIVDLRLAKKLTLFSWKYVPRLNRARAVIVRGKPRVMLHKYIARLLGKKWVEIFFANNDPFDCRGDNLRPYRRDEEGARRKVFKNKKVRFKGVYLKSTTGRYGASIRHNGKLHHLGYFDLPEQAAEAYRKAYKAIHPAAEI